MKLLKRDALAFADRFPLSRLTGDCSEMFSRTLHWNS